jgi:hypothetical protein
MTPCYLTWHGAEPVGRSSGGRLAGDASALQEIAGPMKPAPPHLPTERAIAAWPDFTAAKPLRVLVSGCLAGRPCGVDITTRPIGIGVTSDRVPRPGSGTVRGRGFAPLQHLREHRRLPPVAPMLPSGHAPANGRCGRCSRPLLRRMQRGPIGSTASGLPGGPAHDGKRLHAARRAVRVHEVEQRVRRGVRLPGRRVALRTCVRHRGRRGLGARRGRRGRA